jgi:hypothetical protein
MQGRRSVAFSNSHFAGEQKVELIGGIELPARSRDRNCKTIRRKLAGQYHRNNGGGTDIGGVVIVFCGFDDECHDPNSPKRPYRVSQAIRQVETDLERPAACMARANRARGNPVIYRKKQQR